MELLSEMCNKQSKSAEPIPKKLKKGKRKSHISMWNNEWESSKHLPLAPAPLLKRGESASYYYSLKDTKDKRKMLIKGESHEVDDETSPF